MDYATKANRGIFNSILPDVDEMLVSPALEKEIKALKYGGSHGSSILSRKCRWLFNAKSNDQLKENVSSSVKDHPHKSASTLKSGLFMRKRSQERPLTRKGNHSNRGIYENKRAEAPAVKFLIRNKSHLSFKPKKLAEVSKFSCTETLSSERSSPPNKFEINAIKQFLSQRSKKTSLIPYQQRQSTIYENTMYPPRQTLYITRKIKRTMRLEDSLSIFSIAKGIYLEQKLIAHKFTPS